MQSDDLWDLITLLAIGIPIGLLSGFFFFLILNLR